MEPRAAPCTRTCHLHHLPAGSRPSMNTANLLGYFSLYLHVLDQGAWRNITLDFTGGFPKREGCNAILEIVDILGWISAWRSFFMNFACCLAQMEPSWVSHIEPHQAAHHLTCYMELILTSGLCLNCISLISQMAIKFYSTTIFVPWKQQQSQDWSSTPVTVTSKECPPAD